MNASKLPRFARRPRLLKAIAPTALIPLGVCGGTLALLAAYTATGAAGDPVPRIDVTSARIQLPADSGAAAAAFFEIRNTGTSEDTLLYAVAPDLGVSVISRTVTENGASRVEQVPQVPVPARGTVTMAREGTDVVIPDPPALKPGQKVLYYLWFKYSGKVSVQAVAVGAGS